MEEIYHPIILLSTSPFQLKVSDHEEDWEENFRPYINLESSKLKYPFPLGSSAI